MDGLWPLSLIHILCTGSIPMVGGHGTAGSYGPELEKMGLAGAEVLAMAAATFGLVAGSLMGGPTARSLINKYCLLYTSSVSFGSPGSMPPAS